MRRRPRLSFDLLPRLMTPDQYIDGMSQSQTAVLAGTPIVMGNMSDWWEQQVPHELEQSMLDNWIVVKRQRNQ